MQLVAAGQSNAVIGAQYGVTESTIEKQLGQIYAALGCCSPYATLRRCEAVAIAIRLGIIT